MPPGIVRELTEVPMDTHPIILLSGTILFRGLSGIILAMLPEKNWDTQLISAILKMAALKSEISDIS